LSEDLNPSATLPVVRMLHTSDVHIWDDETSIASLHAVVDAAIQSEVDIVLVAGDLFDNARISDAAAQRTIGELARLGCPVVVIPGNHDCIDERSIYRRVELAEAGDHVFFVADPLGSELMFEELALVVWARGIENHEPSHRPLSSYRPSDPTRWSVVLTHGHYVREGEVSDRSSRITQAEIRQLQCHYVALGHWHRFADVSEPGVKAFYSGSPSEPGSDGASVNFVTLHPESGVHVERRALTQDARGGVLAR
jgi:DNA repair exonuclease SbcCD nuclease subunit